MTSLALLAVGGAFGAVARYRMATWVQRRIGPGFPWGTLAVNTLGSFALGFLLAAVGAHPLRPVIVMLLATGFLGDFTTFSTFAYEAAALGHARAWGRLTAYLVGTSAATMAAVGAGLWLGGVIERWM
ncbi:MAG: fluoride efflux transporter CrcB [Vicinamibacterales bacterium]|nr:fluoride efflux transporter CrcB [Vicinamibacterales bacterium]